MSTDLDYWRECISIAAEECELSLTTEQLDYLADAASGGHEHYGQAFYSPPPSDRLNEIEREHKERYKRLEAEFNKYRDNAELAVKIALKQHRDEQVTIGEYGEVERHGGRSVRIQ